MEKVLKVSSGRVVEMQRNPQEYFRKARAEATRRAAAQLKEEQQRADRTRNQQRGRRLAAG